MSKLKSLIQELAEKERLSITITESQSGVLTIEHTPMPHDVKVRNTGIYGFSITNHDRKVFVSDELLADIEAVVVKYLDGLKTGAQ